MNFYIFCRKCFKNSTKIWFFLYRNSSFRRDSTFKRSVGESSDIVNKEMYQFIDKGQNDVCLRPEGTAGVVRHFVEKLDRAGGTLQVVFKWTMVLCLDMKDLKRKIKSFINLVVKFWNIKCL